MKKLLYIICLVCLVTACDKDDASAPKIMPEATGIFTDGRDGNEYGWVRFGGLDWMASNMKYSTLEGNISIYNDGTYPFETDGETSTEKYFRLYGYLYSHSAALAACPDGWRLPSDDDWKVLESALGTSASDLDRTDWRGSFAGELMQQRQGGTGLNMFPAGYRSITNQGSTAQNHRLFGINGYFWTSTPDQDNINNAWYRKLFYNSPQVFRYAASIEHQMSVRCVRDA